MKKLQLWIEYGSTYTYLTVARAARLAEERGVELDWQPFYLMPILVEQGMNLGPFLPYPDKMAYMWRDIERRAARHGTLYVRPSTYPVNSLLTARVAMVAARKGWCQVFTERVFALHWTQGRLIGTEDNLNSVLTSLGRDPGTIVSAAQSAEIKEALARIFHRNK